MIVIILQLASSWNQETSTL